MEPGSPAARAAPEDLGAGSGAASERGAANAGTERHHPGAGTHSRELVGVSLRQVYLADRLQVGADRGVNRRSLKTYFSYKEPAHHVEYINEILDGGPRVGACAGSEAETPL